MFLTLWKLILVIKYSIYFSFVCFFSRIERKQNKQRIHKRKRELLKKIAKNNCLTMTANRK